ncbi:MAG: hypothetical protein ACE5EU_08965 [Paracoccaceae bacterium]
MACLVRHLRCFCGDDTGAVSVDWVALTSAMLLLGIMVVYAIFNVGVSSLTGNINNTLAATRTTVDIGSAPTLNSGDAVDEDPDGGDSGARCFRFFFWIICFG